MKQVSVYELKKGDVLAKAIVTKGGRPLLEAGRNLTEINIQRLKRLGITHVFITDDRQKNSSIPARIEAKRTSEKRQRQKLESKKTVIENMTKLMDSPIIHARISNQLTRDRYGRIFRNIFLEIAAQPFLLENLIKLHDADGYLFNHSLHVSAISGVVGLAKNYNYNDLLELTVGALMSDIGMIHLPPELLKNRGSLNPEQRKKMESHTQKGYEILSSHPDVPIRAALCALQHHERFDGTGYPLKAPHSKIHEFAQIVAIADVYNALISRRHHRPPYTPNEAAEYLYGAGNQHFDLDLIRLFLNHITVYPLHSTVMLSSGQIGVVTSVEPGLTQRPIVKIMIEGDGTPISDSYELDLRNHLNVVIVKVIEGATAQFD